MAMYEYDSNGIPSKPIENRQTETTRDTFLKIKGILKSRVIDPKCYIMDNGCSSDLKEAMKKYTMDFQLSLPHMLRQNVAKRSIITYKNHFIS